ncbi:hypothetical protein [Elizabethkingia anophelis]|uniref:hypothetical protein n=1 Tax=Elizabethkingia anophelis TaxID=1117645 RepID=UPI003891648C
MASISNTGIETHGVMLSPSMILEAEMVPASLSYKTSQQASSKLNTLANVDGDPLGAGMKFRVIAYIQSDGSYQDYKDYTVGQFADALALDIGAAYNLIAYSYGKTTLPAITVGETTSINSATLNYRYLLNKDFMYQNIIYTPGNIENSINLTLRHKLSLITATVNSMIGNINSITSANISPTYANGTIPLSTGKITYTGASGSVGLSFPSGDALSKTATPVLVSADTNGTLMGDFTASIGVNGAASKTLTLTNAFKITPEYKSNLNINLRTCGAYLGPNQTQWTEFMCQNLGATVGTNPFSPVAANHGSKYQWGENTSALTQAQDQANSGTISGWSSAIAANGSWSDTAKGPNDPCPTGYKVPSKTEWNAVLTNNTIERTNTSWANSSTNFGSALYIKDPVSNNRTLMLPSAGNRYNVNGTLSHRGDTGIYWTSTWGFNAGTPIADDLEFDATTALVNRWYTRAMGYSVRCITE